MSSIGPLLLTLLPIAVIICMLVIWNKPADISGMVGWALVCVIAFFFFQTSTEVLFRSTIAGIIKSFPVSLIVAATMLQLFYMDKTGALKRVIIFIKTIASENQSVQIMILGIGFGTLMVSVGATPNSVLPPIMAAMGYSTFVSIAIPSMGYNSLCTYALLGAPVVVFVDLANAVLGKGHEITLSQAGSAFFLLIPVITLLISFMMLFIIGKWKGVKDGWLPVIVTTVVVTLVSYFTNKVESLVVLTGVFCGIAVIVAMMIYLIATGKKIIDKSKLTAEELAYEKKFPLWKALTPWGLLIAFILVLNVPPSVFNYLYRVQTFPILGLSADGKPILTRVLWNAYTWIFVSIFLSMLFIKPTSAQVKDTFRLWVKKAYRPIIATSSFFIIGDIMNMSGYDMVTKKYAVASMVQVLANFSYQAFSNAYGFVVGFIGLLGGFITGSETSTIAMFEAFAIKTSNMLHMGTTGMLIVIAALAFCGGLASMISPAKLQTAAAVMDKMGEETKVMKVLFGYALLLTFITAALAMVFLKVYA